MYTAGICGHFGFGKNMLDGQTVKTKNICLELEKKFGESSIIKTDTFGGKSRLIHICKSIFKMVKSCKNVVMLPAQNGLILFTPLLRFLNIFYKRKLHYVVIGGWLPEFLGKHRLSKKLLKGFDKIYVETFMMREKLVKLGFKNVLVMPNFKDIKIVNKCEKKIEKPYRFCMFSRVMYEKGIEHAAEAVQKINSESGDIVCKLDIYGPIDDRYTDRFSEVLTKYDSVVTYKGCVPAEVSTDTIKDYYCLLFPTFYSGEGFAGTLIDAFSAGVPVIASDWRYNTEIVEHKANGLICASDDVDSLAQSIKQIMNDKIMYEQMVTSCLESAKKYSPEKVMPILTDEF